MVSNFALEYAIKRIQEYEEMELNRPRQLLVYADNIDLFDENG
jgi:hypothetical protein